MENLFDIFEAFLLGMFACRFIDLKGNVKCFFLTVYTGCASLFLYLANTVYFHNGFALMPLFLITFLFLVLFEDPSDRCSTVWNYTFSMVMGIVYQLSVEFMMMVSKLAYQMTPAEALNTHPYYRLCLCVPVFVPAMVSVCRTSEKYKKLRSRYDSMFAVCFTSLYMAIVLIQDGVMVEKNLFALPFVVNILLGVTAWIVFVMYYKAVDDAEKDLGNRMLYTEMKAVQNNTELFRKNEENLRILKHDLINRMTILKGCLQAGETDRCLALINEHLTDLQETTLVFRTGFTAVDAVLSAKKETADRKKIRMTVRTEITDLSEEAEEDIAVMTGNLLDNAIENIDPAKPVISLLIRQQDHISITVKNNTGNKDPAIRTKKEGEFHGLGLRSVQYLSQKYHGQLYTDLSDGIFFAEVILRDVPSAGQ
ncbi:MAG: GHKL domain-containing protein [Solobacterium sp.]|nr:GHKL domain-containing protein [Solobacterium sp.]